MDGNPLGDERILEVVLNPTTPQLQQLLCGNCGLSIPGWYTFLTTESIPRELRLDALMQLCKQPNRTDQRQILGELGVKSKNASSKDTLTLQLQKRINSKKALQEFLCHEE